ncbi:MAG TPA: hypothetical protein VI233_17375, partial [Puia sp.]
MLNKKYDAFGNLVQQQKVDDLNSAYLWDYSGTYPIAKTVNATSDQMAYTSFEADGTGGWDIRPGYTVSSGSPITGSKYGSDAILSKTVPTGNYTVTAWASGSIDVNGVGGKVINFSKRDPTWRCYRWDLSNISYIQVNTTHADDIRLYPSTAQMTTYTYNPLVGMTSQTDAAGRTTYYEYDGLARLKRIRDQDYNILKTYDYQYAIQGSCGPNCYPIALQTFAGNNTPGYPVGVFNSHYKFLGNAANASDYVWLWNSDTANTAVGTLAAGPDNLHFYLTLNTGKVLPSGVIGCRYYQYDLTWNRLDGIRSENGVYVDFGDGLGTPLPGRTIPAVPVPTNSAALVAEFKPNNYYYLIHEYADTTTTRTITFYHNDTEEQGPGLDNAESPAISLTKLRNLRGNLPLTGRGMYLSSYQDATANTVAGITNWNILTSLKAFWLHCGDGQPDTHPCTNINFELNFMKNHRGLQQIHTSNPEYDRSGVWDPSFKLSRLKTDWNTYFTQLNYIEINDSHWDREDLTALSHLTWFVLVADNQNHSNNLTNNPIIPIQGYVMDNIINQIAAGSGQSNFNGFIYFLPGGTT